MPCNQSCTWIIILAFIIIWFSCANRGGCGSGCNNGCGGNGGCGCNNGCGGF